LFFVVFFFVFYCILGFDERRLSYRLRYTYLNLQLFVYVVTSKQVSQRVASALLLLFFC